MRTIVITGAAGFIGKNLAEHLMGFEDLNLLQYDIHNIDALEEGIAQADFVFHLAGVNRPRSDGEFQSGNVDLTKYILELLKKHRRKITLLLSSSTQAELDNPYGKSKMAAEEAVFSWAKEIGGTALVYRLPNVFGKWCRPNYNSVVATFCYNIARDLPIQINNPDQMLTLVYIDDVVHEFLKALNGEANLGENGLAVIPRSYQVTVSGLAELIRSFRQSRDTLILPNFQEEFSRYLYATYLSYLPENGFAYPADMKEDQRGWLAELLKSNQFGQIFISRTKPGITRGNHWHHTKVEKFIVIEGEALIRFRQIHGTEVIEVPVSGGRITIVDIPAGYTHSITNVGETDLITLFWADEIFNPNQNDTAFLAI